MDKRNTKIVCSQELVELVFVHDQHVQLFVTGSCRQLSILLEKNSGVEIVIEYAADVVCDLALTAVLEENSTLKIVALFFTDQSIQQHFSFVLQGDRSSVDLKGLAVLSDHDNIKIKTIQKHQAVHTRSCVTLLSLVDLDGSFDYTGIIHIEKQASQTQADQQNKNIMLSPRASVRSVPTIEVLNKNVQCFHGSAIGKFDKDHVWYLQSRGLEKDVVQKILIDSFFEPVLRSVPCSQEIKNKIQKKLE